MIRLFVIADTHQRMVLPPADCLTVHCGDFVDAFDANLLQSGRTDHWKYYFREVLAKYSTVVRGNHENILLLNNAADPDFAVWQKLPEIAHLTVEGVRIRVCHTVYLPRPGQKDYPPIPPSLMVNMFPTLKNEGCQLFLCGHDHVQCHLERDGMHIVNPGYGYKGQCAFIAIDNGHIEVELCGKED